MGQLNLTTNQVQARLDESYINKGLYTDDPTLNADEYITYQGDKFFAVTPGYTCDSATYPDPNNDTNLKKESDIITFNNVEDMKSSSALKDGLVAAVINNVSSELYRISSSGSESADNILLDNGNYAILDETYSISKNEIVAFNIYPRTKGINAQIGQEIPAGTSAIRINNQVWAFKGTKPFDFNWSKTTPVDAQFTAVDLGQRELTIGAITYEIVLHHNCLVDEVNSPNSTLDIEHYSNGTGSPNGSSYGLDIHNNVGAQSAILLHQYSNNGPAMQIDNTYNQPSILINNTINPTRNPGGPALYGEGDYLRFVRNGANKLSLDANFIWRPAEGLPFDIVGQAGTGALRAQTGAGNTEDTVEVSRIESAGFAINCTDGSAQLKFGIRGDGKINYTASGNIQPTVGSAGTADALPTNPEFYLRIFVDGLEYAVPAFKQS